MWLFHPQFHGKELGIGVGGESHVVIELRAALGQQPNKQTNTHTEMNENRKNGKIRRRNSKQKKTGDVVDETHQRKTHINKSEQKKETKHLGPMERNKENGFRTLGVNPHQECPWFP